MVGFVSLVGAGPGDPELITVKGARRLAEADLVLYDALVSPELLALAPRARRFFVGKRAGRRSIAQGTLNRLLIRAARRGERVVRLKCGDPFVLGRGGEEGLALAEAGIHFEVVPGLSSAIAAPALSGIPVTHRGLASGFLVLSGHAPDTYRPLLEAVAPGSMTLVVLMGVASRQQVAKLLLERGWLPDTSVALCSSASTPMSRTWRGTLVELAFAPNASVGADSELEPTLSPGVLVIGEVVALADRLWPARAESEASGVGDGSFG